jgi:hypothetical protein
VDIEHDLSLRCCIYTVCFILELVCCFFWFDWLLYIHDCHESILFKKWIRTDGNKTVLHVVRAASTSCLFLVVETGKIDK